MRKKLFILMLLSSTACVQIADKPPVQAVVEMPTNQTWLDGQIAAFAREINEKHNFKLVKPNDFKENHEIKYATLPNIERLDLNDNLVQLSYVGSIGRGMNPHVRSVREYRILDVQRQKIVPVKEVLSYPVRAQMVEKMYQKLLEYQNMGWRGTPKNEAERRVWLVQYMPYVFEYGGHFKKNNDGGLNWEFCSVPTMDNHYQACANIENVQPEAILNLAWLDR